jgi:2-haloacid dehalogenase
MIRTVVFDAYGTLYDVHSVRRLCTELCGDKGDLITQLWRLKQLEYTWLRGLMRSYEDFWLVTRASLEFSLESVGIIPKASLCERLMDKYLDLDLYPEAREALAALKGYQLAILSNGSPNMLQKLVRASGIESSLAAVISVDLAKTYKPNPECYALVEKVLAVRKDEVLFVSSNGFDVAGARRFGFQVAWIARHQRADRPVNSNVGPAELYALLRGGAEKLGYDATFRISALTDLPSLLTSRAT